MAKKPKKEAVKPDEPKAVQAMPAAPAKKDAGKPTESKGTPAMASIPGAKGTAKAVQMPVAPPVVVPPPVVEPVKKTKRPRFVREKKEKRAQATPVALPPRSTKATAKLMTKGLAVPPKDETPAGQKPRG